MSRFIILFIEPIFYDSQAKETGQNGLSRPQVHSSVKYEYIFSIQQSQGLPLYTNQVHHFNLIYTFRSDLSHGLFGSDGNIFIFANRRCYSLQNCILGFFKYCPKNMFHSLLPYFFAVRCIYLPVPTKPKFIYALQCYFACFRTLNLKLLCMHTNKKHIVTFLQVLFYMFTIQPV